MKNKSLGSIIALVAIAVIGGSVISYQQFQQQTTTQEMQTNNFEKSQMRGFGQLYLLDYGNEISADAARSKTGFAMASTPSSVMDNLVLKSVRVRDYAESHLMTAFYVTPATTLRDLDTFESVMNNGGIIVIYAEEKLSPTYDPQKWREEFVQAAPQVRKSDTINDYPSIVITGNPDKDIRSEVLIYKDNLQIDIVSVKHNVDELLRVAQLITKG